MKEEDLKEIINKLISNKGEFTYIECKGDNYDENMIGKALSGLSNSASYENQDYGYMI